MASQVLTRGLILCLSAISCYGFLDIDVDNKDKLGSYGCSGLTAPTNGVKGVLTEDSFSKSKKLSDDYELKWKFNSTHILFQAHVKVKGFVALGISQREAMFPSDLMVAWVDDDEMTHFSDRHSEGHYLPVVDDNEDWHLVSAVEAGGYTTVTVIRPLDPCDEQDMPIKAGGNFVIHADSSEDPAPGKDIFYHGVHRGVTSIDLLAN